MEKRIVNQLAEKKIKQGYMLLESAYFSTLSWKDGIVSLYSERGTFLGTAYLSRQNKGVGWLISDKEVVVDSSFFCSLFLKARKKRHAYQDSERTTAYRVFNQDGDGFGGFTVDIYHRYAVFSWYNAFIYRLKDQIVAAFQRVFPEIVGGYEKIRFKGPDYESAHLFGQESSPTFTILEHGVSYQVFLNDGLMTGIFLDQHDVRGRLIEGLATGKRVLNLFSYTAAFSVAAAMGGAIETTSVDLAKRSRELSEAHFLANGMALDHHRLVVMDVFDYLKYAKRQGLLFDLIVIDPPSFARNKKKTFSVAKDYHRLVAQAVEILSPNGVLITSTNASNLSLLAFRQQIEKGLTGIAHQFLSIDRLPSDFVSNKNDESSNYLKVFTIQVNK